MWDLKHLKQEVKTLDIDQAAGVIMPFFDPDTNLLYLAGKVSKLVCGCIFLVVFDLSFW